jgi:hypothetical protein
MSAPYARSEDSNGQHYKSIQLEDRIYVWASFRHDRSATLNVIVTNEGKQQFDVNPPQFTCVCFAGKPKIGPDGSKRNGAEGYDVVAG